MSGSNVNPNQWNGEVRSGGFLAKNSKPTGTNSPQWKGKFYLIGYGWIWLSAWERDSRSGPILKLMSQDMSDEHATKYCAPKPGQTGKDRPLPRHAEPKNQNGGASDSDIPF